MSAFDYFLMTLPFFCWYCFRAVSKGFAKEICALFRSVVYNQEFSSACLALQQNEANTLLKILKEHTNESFRVIQHDPVEFIPQKAKFWLWGGSATVLCKIQTHRDRQSICVGLTVRYQQRLSVKPWLIVDIAATNTR